MGIIIGFLGGMLVANPVVQYIKTPMETALGEFHSKLVIAKFEKELAAGKSLPYSLEEVNRLVNEEGLLFDIYYFNQSELAGRLKPSSENATDDSSPTDQEEEQASATSPSTRTPLTAADLQPIFLWHRIQDDQRVRLIGLSVQDSFMIWIKAALLVGLVLAGPWVFWQIWSFVAAGLYPHEKRYVHLFMPFSIFLFLLGASVAFLFVFRPVLNFLLSFYASMDIDPDQRITDWLSFVLMLPLAFGISFQLPLVMLFLERIGIFDVTAYLQKWRIAILVIFVVSMIMSPGGDPYSMLLMAVPLTFLYFGGVLLCRYLPKGKNPFDHA
jgi:sec-independent protein translocase protein TatC